MLKRGDVEPHYPQRSEMNTAVTTIDDLAQLRCWKELSGHI